eukprot:5071876-Pleurochrysis_carterae.AAC.5
MALSMLLLAAPQTAGFAIGMPSSTITISTTASKLVASPVMSGSASEPATYFRQTLAKGLVPCAATALLVASFACAGDFSPPSYAPAVV